MPDDLLIAILAELRGLRADMRRQSVTAPLADRLILAAHPVVDQPFNQAELLARAASRLSSRLELRAVVDDVCRGLDLPGAGRRLGRFLADNVQHEVEGLRLVYVGKSRRGRVYRIELAAQTRARLNAWEFSTRSDKT